MGLFDVFKDKDDEDDKGEATEEINFESFKNEDSSSGTEQEPKQETPSYSPLPKKHHHTLLPKQQARLE